VSAVEPVTLEEMQSLVGRRFPGGSARVERWENFLLHEVVGMTLPPDRRVHPIGLFHVPLAACGWSYAEIFEICRAESDEAVRAGEYEWVLHGDVLEGVDFDITGEFISVDRKKGRSVGDFDRVTFRLDMAERASGEPIATVTNTWLFIRSTP